MATQDLKHEYNQNADAYVSHCSGFQLGGRNDKKENVRMTFPSLSSSDPTGGTTLPLSPSDLTGGSIMQQCRMDSRLRGNDRGEKMSPSGLTGGSIRKQCRLAQSGRSMVEMLGTLAIIGVLSIGGIAGYSYSMNKYKANQTINDIMLMGVDIITQLSQNRGTPTLSSDWGTKTTAGYDFEIVQNPTDTTQYGLKITGVSSSICKIVGDGLKQTVAVYVGSDDYNTDTETDPCDESDKNTMEFYFEAVFYEECKTDTDCGENKYCDNGWCFSGEKPIGTPMPPICTTDADCGECSDGCVWDSYQNRNYCINTQHNFGKICTLSDGSNGMCYWGECIKTGCTYDTNKCEKGHYCSSPADYGDCQPFPDGKTGSCVKTDFRLLKIDGKSYYVSNTIMSWWDADAACKALEGNKSLIDLSELVLNSDGTKWDGRTSGYKLNTIAQQLFDFIIMPEIWTNVQYDDCHAYYLPNDGRDIWYTERSYDRHAVCR